MVKILYVNAYGGHARVPNLPSVVRCNYTLHIAVLGEKGRWKNEQGVIIREKSKGEIANTAGANSRAIFHDGTGTITISGGTVSATSSYAIYNTGTGTLTISNNGGNDQQRWDGVCLWQFSQ